MRKIEAKECLYLGTGVESKKKNELGRISQFVGGFEKLCLRDGGDERGGRRESKCLAPPKMPKSVECDFSSYEAKWGK